MSKDISKKVSVQYFGIVAAEDNYFSKLPKQLAVSSGSFKAGNLRYSYEVLERIDGTDMYMLSCVKERVLWPHIMNDDGDYAELSLGDATLGDISYCLVCPTYEFIITYGSPAIFKRLFGQFSREGIVRLTPFYEPDIVERAMNWDCYKKLSLHLNMPSGEDVTSFQSTRAGELMEILSHLGGLKLDITVSAWGGRELLSNMMVKDLLPELLANDLCTSLTVRGSDFENVKSEQFDLKNAQIKYHETVEFEGSYITAEAIKQIFMRALNQRARMLLTEVGK